MHMPECMPGLAALWPFHAPSGHTLHMLAGSAWEACTTFTKILQALATSFQHLAPEPENDCVVRCFRRLAWQYAEKMEVFNGPRKQRPPYKRRPRLRMEGC